MPARTSLMVVLMFSTALLTPLPPKRLLSPSRSSRASNSPVDAPLGAAPRPIVPSASHTLCLDGGVAAGVDDLAANDLLNFQIAHGTKSFLYKLLFQYARNGIKRYFKVSAS